MRRAQEKGKAKVTISETIERMSVAKPVVPIPVTTKVEVPVTSKSMVGAEAERRPIFSSH